MFCLGLVYQRVELGKVGDDRSDLASGDVEISCAVQHDQRLASATVIVEDGRMREHVAAARCLGVVGRSEHQCGLDGLAVLVNVGESTRLVFRGGDELLTLRLRAGGRTAERRGDQRHIEALEGVHVDILHTGLHRHVGIGRDHRGVGGHPILHGFAVVDGEYDRLLAGDHDLQLVHKGDAVVEQGGSDPGEVIPTQELHLRALYLHDHLICLVIKEVGGGIFLILVDADPDALVYPLARLVVVVGIALNVVRVGQMVGDLVILGEVKQSVLVFLCGEKLHRSGGSKGLQAEQAAFRLEVVDRVAAVFARSLEGDGRVGFGGAQLDRDIVEGDDGGKKRVNVCVGILQELVCDRAHGAQLKVGNVEVVGGAHRVDHGGGNVGLYLAKQRLGQGVAVLRLLQLLEDVNVGVSLVLGIVAGVGGDLVTQNDLVRGAVDVGDHKVVLGSLAGGGQTVFLGTELVHRIAVKAHIGGGVARTGDQRGEHILVKGNTGEFLDREGGARCKRAALGADQVARAVLGEVVVNILILLVLTGLFVLVALRVGAFLHLLEGKGVYLGLRAVLVRALDLRFVVHLDGLDDLALQHRIHQNIKRVGVGAEFQCLVAGGGNEGDLAVCARGKIHGNDGAKGCLIGGRIVVGMRGAGQLFSIGVLHDIQAVLFYDIVFGAVHVLVGHARGQAPDHGKAACQQRDDDQKDQHHAALTLQRRASAAGRGGLIYGTCHAYFLLTIIYTPAMKMIAAGTTVSTTVYCVASEATRFLISVLAKGL